MLSRFNDLWDSVPLVVVDTETTGKQPGIDRAVSFGIARFENGQFVGGVERLVNPGTPIPTEATAIHKITDAMVADAPSLHEAFFAPEVQDLLKDAQPAAYNAAYDRHFIPPFGERWDWPWLDGLMLVRKADRFAKGKGRHKLEASCARNGIVLESAHSALADARACGQLIIKLGRELFPKDYTLGRALDFCRRAEIEEWLRFNQWLSTQPPLPKEGAT